MVTLHLILIYKLFHTVFALGPLFNIFNRNIICMLVRAFLIVTPEKFSLNNSNAVRKNRTKMRTIIKIYPNYINNITYFNCSCFFIIFINKLTIIIIILVIWSTYNYNNTLEYVRVQQVLRYLFVFFTLVLCSNV